MSIVRHEGRLQMCCDDCPASFAPTFPAGAFRDLAEAAKQAGWRIDRKLPKSRDTSDLFGKPPRIAGPKEEPFTHSCPACANPAAPRGGLL